MIDLLFTIPLVATGLFYGLMLMAQIANGLIVLFDKPTAHKEIKEEPKKFIQKYPDSYYQI